MKDKLPPYVHFDANKKSARPYYYVIRIGKRTLCKRGFATPEEAYSAAMHFKRDPSLIKKSVTLGQAVDFWLASLVNTHVRESIQNYKSCFSNWIYPYIEPAKDYAKITDAELSVWYSIINRTDKLNIVSKNRLRTALFQLHKFAYAFLEIENRSILRLARFSGEDLSPFFESEHKPVLTSEEFRAMLRSAPDDYSKLLISLALCCGLRIGEARGLTVDCYKDGKICVAKQVKGDGEGHSKLSKTKTVSSRRVCQLPESVSKCLENHIEVNRLKSTDFIFFGSECHSKPASENLINNRFATAAESGGVGKIYSHIFRHTVATILGRAGIRQRAIDMLLGHAPKSVTDKHYNLVIAADWSDIISVLNSEIFSQNVINNVINV